jgi:hypothetical protein
MGLILFEIELKSVSKILCETHYNEALKVCTQKNRLFLIESTKG